MTPFEKWCREVGFENPQPHQVPYIERCRAAWAARQPEVDGLKGELHLTVNEAIEIQHDLTAERDQLRAQVEELNDKLAAQERVWEWKNKQLKEANDDWASAHEESVAHSQKVRADLARTEAERATLWQHGLDMSRERDRAREALDFAGEICADIEDRLDCNEMWPDSYEARLRGAAEAWRQRHDSAALKPPEGT